MLTFAEFVSEATHQFCANSYKDWGIIHPSNGTLISGKDHPKARSHNQLKDALKKKHPNIRHAAEWAHVDYGHGGPNGYGSSGGHLMIRNVHPGNKDSVLKAYKNLPHHPSGQVMVNDKEGNHLQMYNHIRNMRDYSDYEND